MKGAIEIYRGLVNTWECDVMGHMNVQFYTGKATEGMAHLRAAWGMTPRRIRETGLAMVAARTLVRYVSELRAGEILTMRAGLTAIGERTVAILVEVLNAESGRTSAWLEVTGICFDMNGRRAVPWPQDVRAGLERLRIERPELRAPGTGRPSAAPAGGFAEPFVSARGTVMSWQCDEFGHMSAGFYMNLAAHAVAHIKHRMGMREAGSAALEYDVHFLRELKAGDIVSLRSGFLDAGSKAFRFGHRLYNEATGELCATYEAVGCLFDLEARRALPLGDELRARLAAQVIRWPPAEIADRVGAAA